MTEMPSDTPKRATSIDKAKEASRYDQATAVAIDKLRSLLGGDGTVPDGHPLVDVYVQELVRCETVRQMKDDTFSGAQQLTGHLRALLSEKLGDTVAKDLAPIIQRWTREFRNQLGHAEEVTRRKKSLEQAAKDKEPGRYLGTPLESSELQLRQGRYNLEIQDRGEGEFALQGTPRYGQFDTDRVAKILGPEFAVGFPFEVDSDDDIFVVDYDGTILSYGQGETESLLQSANALVRRLENCFAP